MQYRINFKAVQTTEDIIKLLSVVMSGQVLTIPNELYKVLDKEGYSQYFTFVPDDKERQEESKG
jgi:hypothetical protein